MSGELQMEMTTTRRAVLVSVAATVPTMSAVAASLDVGPALSAFREWHAAYGRYWAAVASGNDDDTLDAAIGQVNEIEQRIVELPAFDPNTAGVIVAFQLYEVLSGTISDDWYRGGAIRAMAAALLPTMPAEVADFVRPLIDAPVPTRPARWTGGAA